MRQTTLCLIVREDEILLALKKRGFGKDKWNGYGGKPQDNEDLENAAIRETQEEIGVRISSLEKFGRIEFYFENNPDWNQEVNIFKIKTWEGEPVETEEMRPQWFKFVDIPFERMWLEDKYWMPLFLASKKFEGEVYYNSDGTKILKYDISEIK